MYIQLAFGKGGKRRWERGQGRKGESRRGHAWGSRPPPRSVGPSPHGETHQMDQKSQQIIVCL